MFHVFKFQPTSIDLSRRPLDDLPDITPPSQSRQTSPVQNRYSLLINKITSFSVTMLRTRLGWQSACMGHAKKLSIPYGPDRRHIPPVYSLIIPNILQYFQLPTEIP